MRADVSEQGFTSEYSAGAWYLADHFLNVGQLDVPLTRRVQPGEDRPVRQGVGESGVIAVHVRAGAFDHLALVQPSHGVPTQQRQRRETVVPVFTVVVIAVLVVVVAVVAYVVVARTLAVGVVAMVFVNDGRRESAEVVFLCADEQTAVAQVQPWLLHSSCFLHRRVADARREETTRQIPKRARLYNNIQYVHDLPRPFYDRYSQYVHRIEHRRGE